VCLGVLNANAQPEIDPKMIVLVRRVCAPLALIFQGHVEGEAVAAGVAPPLAPAAESPAPARLNPANQPNNLIVDRVHNYLRAL